MKQPKQRLIVLDYFRGLCILIILLSHSSLYTRPYAYLSGMGRLWISAAELFFLLSGLTLGVVRGGAVVKDFKSVRLKSWIRARNIYLIYLFSVAASLLIFNFIPLDKFIATFGGWTASGRLSFLIQILTLRVHIGLANFLIYYTVYMIFAPFALYALYKYRRLWPAVPLVSGFIFLLNMSYPLRIASLGAYSDFATWQFYFVIGMTLARFRQPITKWFYGLDSRVISWMYRAVTLSALAVLTVSGTLGFNVAPVLARLTVQGWIPRKLYGAYLRLVEHRTGLDGLFMNGRTGILRPFIVLLILTAAYLFYQKHKDLILKYSSKFVTAMGRDTLWIFVGQALVIPLMFSLPQPINFVYSTLLTAALVGSMWLVTQRRSIWAYTRAYLSELKVSYSAAKYNYLRQYEDAS